MEVTTVRFPQDIEKWYLVSDFLRKRKTIFVDRLKWKLFHADGMEFEQYDTLSSVYIIAHDDGEVLGGVRLIRTDQAQSTGKVVYTYMIRDACLGLLPGLPDDLCWEEPPMDPDMWEATRMAVFSRKLQYTDLVYAINEFLKTAGAKECLFLGPPAFYRMSKMSGFDAKPIGPVTGNEDGKFLVFSCPVI